MDIKAVLRTAIPTVIKVTISCRGFHSFIFFKMNEKVQAKYAKVHQKYTKGTKREDLATQNLYFHFRLKYI